MIKVLENVVAMFVYGAAYLIIIIIAAKIVGATITQQYEKKIADDNNTGLAVMMAGFYVGMAILLASIIR